MRQQRINFCSEACPHVEGVRHAPQHIDAAPAYAVEVTGYLSRMSSAAAPKKQRHFLAPDTLSSSGSDTAQGAAAARRLVAARGAK